MSKTENERGELEESITTKIFKKEWKEVQLFKIANDIPNIPLAIRKWMQLKIDEAVEAYANE